MGEEDQVRPFAYPTPSRFSIDEDNTLSSQTPKNLRRKRCLQCCGCLTVTLLIVIVIFIILIFTVFKVKNPSITFNSVQFDHVSVSNSTTPSAPSLNLTDPNSQTTAGKPSISMTMTANMSVKNPNIASFKFNNATTNLYYYGSEIGEALNPPGNAKARKTLNMNLTINLYIDGNSSSSQVLEHLSSDLSSGTMAMQSYTSMDGRVNVINIFKKNINIKMNCTITVSISSSSSTSSSPSVTLEDMICKTKVHM
ncbi:hypothetical protein NE237_012332 [Protea cynaroides]|uniref:Late embryogenesis abundant protein LEA-2 subgroup domain-containing protein n=1 Tax=Protea cynaroides TaxID=273540 RepID=A0A9Q0JWS8_9MAGN|nr:hypothetical protein NE237_012332 [Protea cynaroides]